MQTFDDVLDAARTLTPSDRIRLLEALWEDFPPVEWPAPSQEWIEEAQRRSRGFDEGRESASPWSQVRIRARRKAMLDD